MNDDNDMIKMLINETNIGTCLLLVGSSISISRSVDR